MVFDTQPDAAQVLGHAGAKVAGNVGELSACDRIVLCLPDSDTVEAVLLDSSRGPCLGEVLADQCLVIDCSTTSPETSRLVDSRLRAAYVDAPVTGERRRAEEGTLTIMVGGDEADYHRALPVLEPMSSLVVYMGSHGNGQLAKALNNCLYNVSCAAMAEVLALATKSGLDTQALCQIVSGGSGQSFGFDKFSGLVGQRKFSAPEFGYPMGSAFKDMKVVAETAQRHGGADLAVIQAAKRVYEEALGMGLAREHKGAMTKVYEAKLGVTVEHGK
mmetsp:Transcript_40959/g.124101  ORF Transcript_40959/g.124101 Transcript_40959/m.124101 type:complete len:274 (+) Transcript_40959:1-822(+)